MEKLAYVENYDSYITPNKSTLLRIKCQIRKFIKYSRMLFKITNIINIECDYTTKLFLFNSEKWKIFLVTTICKTACIYIEDRFKYGEKLIKSTLKY